VSAYVKISDGCDHRCSFCAIPLIKGHYEVVPPAQVLAAAHAALARGARELVLVGQDTSRYRIEGWGGLERLLAELGALEPAPAWLRLLYLQPENVDERLLAALAAHAVPYLDVPFQHASGRVLAAMGRRGDGEAHLALLERARRALPGVAVRSTFIVGHPGETESDFEKLVAFVREPASPSRASSPSTPRRGRRPPRCPAAARRGDGGARCPLGRGDRGRRGAVLGSAGRPPRRGARRARLPRRGEALGRVATQAPDVDGRTLLRGGRLRRGDLVAAEVTQTLGFDLAAAAVPRATARRSPARRREERR